MNPTDINRCIDIINRPPKSFFQSENIEEKLHCFETIQKVGTSSVIHFLIRFLKSSNTLIRGKSAETILHLFAKLKSQNHYSDSLKHLSIDKSDLNSYRRHFDEQTYLQLLGIASLNSSGFVREKAITEIVRLKNKKGIKFILFRLGDWVLPIRKVAHEAMNTFLESRYIDQLLKELPTIDSLLKIKRVDLTETHKWLIQFIVSQEHSIEFSGLLNHLDDKTRLAYYKHLFRYKKTTEEQIPGLIKDKNFLVRLEVLKQLTAFDTNFQKKYIQVLLRDHSSKVKINALYAAKPYSPDFDIEINKLLSDEAVSVRELSRHLLKPKAVDFAQIYRQRITKGELLAGSLSGLSEVGLAEDLPVFERYINSNKSKIVIASLMAINKFSSDKAKYYSLEILTHPIKRVRDKAAEVLARNRDSDTLQKVRAIYSSGNSEIKKTVLHLYKSIGGWDVAGDLLISLTDKDNNIQNIGWWLLDRWKAKAIRLFSTPPRAEIERANYIYKNLDRSKIGLTESRTNLLNDLQFYLR